MTTKIYGHSDDLLEFDGDLYDEIDCYRHDVTVRLSDGTLFKSHYGKVIGPTSDGLDAESKEEGIWSLTVIEKGSLFESKTECFDSEADPYSDVLLFKDGLTDFKVIKFEDTDQ